MLKIRRIWKKKKPPLTQPHPPVPVPISAPLSSPEGTLTSREGAVPDFWVGLYLCICMFRNVRLYLGFSFTSVELYFLALETFSLLFMWMDCILFTCCIVLHG